MKFKAMAIAIFIASGIVPQIDAEIKDTVTVCLDAATNVSGAEPLAAQIFWQAGIELDWRGLTRCRSEAQGAIVVNLLQQTPRDVGPVALGRACLIANQGGRIDIFMDRFSKFPTRFQPVILAHVLAHEIAHVLQGVPRHSAIGIMKAQFSQDDFDDMRFRPLRFTQEDIALIRLGIASRPIRRPEAMNSASVGERTFAAVP
jgi:hypothetical protein